MDYAVTGCEIRIEATHKDGIRKNQPGLYALLKSGSKCATSSGKIRIEMEKEDGYTQLFLKEKYDFIHLEQEIGW